MEKYQISLLIKDEEVQNQIIKNLQNFPVLNIDKIYKNSVQSIGTLCCSSIDLLIFDVEALDIPCTEFLAMLQNRPLFKIAIIKDANITFSLLDNGVFDVLLMPISDIGIEKKLIKVLNFLSERHTQLFSTMAATYLKELFEKNTEDENSIFCWQQAKDKHLIQVENILYIQSIGNYLQIYSEIVEQENKTKKVELRQVTLNQILAQLPENYFFRVNRSCIVNIRKVSMYNKKCVQINDKKIPITAHYKKSFLSVLEKYINAKKIKIEK